MSRSLVLAAILLVGCDNKAKTEPAPAPLPQIIQDQKQVLDSAKAIGDTLERQAEDQRRRIERAAE